MLGKEHPGTLISLNNLAALYEAQGRYSGAEPLYKRALEVSERVLGKEHPYTLGSVNNLAALYEAQGRFSEAEPLFRRVLEARQRVFGKERPDTLTSVNNLAALYESQGRYSEAEPLFKRALEASERVLGKEHPQTLGSVNNLAALYFAQRDWTRAAQFWRRSTAVIAGRTQRGTTGTGTSQTVAGKKKSEAEQLSWQFRSLVRAVFRLAPAGTAAHASALREMFETAQWVYGSEAAQSLAQMAARGAAGNPELAALTRHRQDLLAEWQRRDAFRNVQLGKFPGQRDAKAEAENEGQLAAIEMQIKEIDRNLVAKFPDYAALASPAPLASTEVQVAAASG